MSMADGLEEAGMFSGFKVERISVGEVTLRVRHGGDGPPVVLTSMHDGLAPQIFAALATPPGQVRTAS